MIHDNSMNDIFGCVWSNIEKEYRTGRINSERCLQAILYGKLSGEFAKSSVYVEPSLLINGSNIIPDIVISKGRDITDIFELKFEPHAYAVYQDDLNKFDKLAKLHENEHGFNIDIDPKTGKFSGKLHKITNQTLFHFVVITRDDAVAINRETLAGFLNEAKPRFHLWAGCIGPKNLGFTVLGPNSLTDNKA